jgi:hypothetical protein
MKPKAIGDRRGYDPENEVDACQQCNQIKANTPYEAYVHWIWLRGARQAKSDRLAYRRYVYGLTLRGLGLIKQDEAGE